MANQPAKSNSRWGSFLTQAVAGMEAHLDSMLAEGEGSPATGKIANKAAETPKREATPSNAPAAAPPEPKAAPAPAAAPRTSSSNRMNSRLQERLAKAMVAKGSSAPSETNSARDSLDAASATAAGDQASPRQSLDTGSIRSRPSISADAPPRAPSPMRMGPKKEQETEKPKPESVPVPETPKESKITDSIVVSTPDVRPSFESGRDSPALPLTPGLAPPGNEAQDELHRYIEQVDALQSKLQYLSKEASEAARKAVTDAAPGTAERKLAEKDGKIAALMEEGRSMAANEQKLRTVIKKLRTQVADNEKTIAELKISQEKTQRDLISVRARTSRLEELEKEQVESQKLLSRARSDLESLLSDLDIRDATVKSLKAELQKAHDENASAASKQAVDALAAEQKKTKELEETIASLQVEKNLAVERAKKNIVETNEKADQAAERARLAELELKSEMQAMEAKLEAMRALAEETSSGAVGDSQAKLLRQMETLQTQHAIASENWQGIEATLLARVANLEKERDEALKRESEMRKKARETTLRCKRQEEEIEELTAKMPDQQKEVDSLQKLNDSLQKRAETAESNLAQAKADFEKQQAAWRTERSEQPDRRLWLEDAPGSRNQSRPDSPLLSVPTRTFSSDLVSLQAPPGKGRKISTPNSATDGFHDAMSPMRRLSSQPPTRPPILSPAFGLSSASLASFEPSLDTPRSRHGDRDDDFDGVETSSSPRQALQDMVSVSTVGAGPSVQLVERMSAAIRRLEAEKVASKEELARISAQRDEARAEIVAQMKEQSSNKAASNRVAELELEVAEINSRYQTTLELLGEKSEMVEELKADVQDVKAMYRDLVERTVKG